MNQNQNHNLLEDLIKASQKNTETLLELYFRTVNEDVSNEEILQSLSNVQRDLITMQSTIKFNLTNAKKHKKS